MRIRRIAVFCGSKSGSDPAYAKAAHVFGRLAAERGIGLVTGGGHVGLMGVVADAALAAGGEVIGVIPHGLVVREVAHEGLTDLVVVNSMHERKAKMADLVDAFVALPGGIGTLEELFEAWTWSALGINADETGRTKPIGLLNAAGYYDDLLAFVHRSLADGFVRPRQRVLLVDATRPESLLDKLTVADAPIVEQWLTRDES
ncbi:MAG: TIGR00730 family Rossman fold protein [Bacteroidota bacterium]